MGNLNLELTRREKEVLDQASLGQTNAEIARELNISAVTVKDHLSSIFWKLRVSPARTRALPLQTWATRRCDDLIGERSRM